MNVTEKTGKSKTVQINDIAMDTAFRGKITFPDNSSATGIWIKVGHNNNDAIRTNGEFVVVGLTMKTVGGSCFPCTARCLPVYDYEPINELSIEVIS